MGYDFIQARNYTKSGNREPNLIVLHTMENPEKPGTALGVAKWFAGPLAPKASAHYCIDNSMIVQCVGELDVAWGAPGANRTGIHLEHPGYASQTEAGWGDAYSSACLKLSAQLAAGIAFRWAVPLRHLTPAEIKAGESGFCGHVDVTHAYNTKGGHIDPGTHFPWDSYMQLVKDSSNELCYTSP